MSEEPPKPTGLINPTDPISEERQAAIEARRKARAALPAVYVDTWATLVWPGHLRFVLGEWVHGGPNYRGAFVMEFHEVERFANALLDIIKQERERRDAESEENVAGTDE